MKIMILPFLLMLTACYSSPWNQPQSQDYESRLHHLRLQQFCSDAATRFWKEFYGRENSPTNPANMLGRSILDTTSFNSSHYSEGLNKCLVQVEATVDTVAASNRFITIFDALEGREIAHKSIHTAPNLPNDSIGLWKDDQQLQTTDANLKWFDALMSE